MHSLQIVHFDIKNDNIMYSKELEKLVMIDYGLSLVTDYVIGKKKQIAFRGTLDYSSPEMAQNFFL